MARQTQWTRLDDLMERLMPRKLHVHLDICSESCWAAEVKFITHPSPGVDMGITFFTAAGMTPDEVLARCLDELDGFLRSEGKVTEAMSAALEGR